MVTPRLSSRVIILLFPACTTGCLQHGVHPEATHPPTVAETGTVSIVEPFEYARVRLGTRVRIRIHAPNREMAETAASAAFERITQLEAILSDYQITSEACQLAETRSGHPRVVSEDMFRILNRSRTLSIQTHGAFDVTCGSLTSLWRDAFAQEALPESEQVQIAASQVGWPFLHLNQDDQTVLLDLEGMRLDFGAIGKGWIADEALVVLQNHGCRQVLVEIGGDLAIGDPPPNEPGWAVGVALDAGAPAHTLLLSNCGVATSGDAEQFMELDGVRYSHILDPRTGWPLERQIAVAIKAPDAATADALASAVCVLGPVAGQELVGGWSGVSILASSMSMSME